MSLFRQLLLTISAVFLLLLAGVQMIYVMNARNYLQQQLESHAQDAATALSLSLAEAMKSGDQVLLETIVNPMFDRGFYQSIQVVSSRGEVLVDKTLPRRPPDVPAWFSRAVVLEAPSSQALISADWRQLGRVIVTSHPNFAYQQLWGAASETLGLLLAAYALALYAMHLFLSTILRPLLQIRETAQAIGERKFPVLDIQPRAPELQAVAQAINSMSGKIRAAIDTEVERAQVLRREAFSDSVSGLDNRRGFEQSMDGVLRSQQESAGGVLFIIEINGFDAYNQRHGYQCGDELLAHIGRALGQLWQKERVQRARLGGAIFVIAMDDVALEPTRHMADHLAAALELALAEYRTQDALEFSCGGCHFGAEKPDLSALMSGADMALAQARNAGANRYALLAHAGETHADKGSQYWKTEISQALEQQRFALFSHAVLGAAHEQPLQREIIARMLSPLGETIGADQFLPMAVRHRLAASIDRFVVSHILRHLATHKRPQTSYAINIAASSMQDADFIDWLKQALLAQPKLAKQMVFEVSEIGVVRDLEQSWQFAQTVRATGAGFAVDNFGLHHEAFHYLQRLMPDYIKLNRGFSEHLAQNREDQFFVESVVKICQPLEIHVIAVGIEDAAALPLLRRIGVHGYQGYVTGQPERIV